MILIERLTPKKRALGFDTEGNLVARECVKCTNFLAISNFCKHRGTNLGYNTCCKYCLSGDKLRKEIQNARRRYRRLSDERVRLKNKEYRQNNKDKIRATDNIWKSKNKHKVRKYSNNWKRVNRDCVYDYTRRRQLKIKGSSLKLPEEVNSLIKDVYRKCIQLNEESEVKFQVDHIVPITNEHVCGLHVPWNLQILTSSENQSKKNKFDGTYENESWRSDL